MKIILDSLEELDALIAWRDGHQKKEAELVVKAENTLSVLSGLLVSSESRETKVPNVFIRQQKLDIKPDTSMRAERPKTRGTNILEDGFSVKWKHQAKDFIESMTAFTLKDLMQEEENTNFHWNTSFIKWFKSEVDKNTIQATVTKRGTAYVFTPYKKVEDGKIVYGRSLPQNPTYHIKGAPPKPIRNRELDEDHRHVAPHLRDPDRPEVYATTRMLDERNQA